VANDGCLLNTASVKQSDDPVCHGFNFVKAFTAGAAVARQVWCDNIKAVAREVSAGQHPNGMVQASTVDEDNS
jgi:hypothetical protein